MVYWFTIKFVFEAISNVSRNFILKFIRETSKGIFGCHNHIEVKRLTRLRLEMTFRFLLSCPIYDEERMTLLSKIRNINPNFLENTNYQITDFLLYKDNNFTALTDVKI